MTVVLGCPPKPVRHCHRRRLSPQPQAAGSRAQALHKGSPEGKFGTRSLLARCSVLHPAKAGCKNRDGFFSRRGGFTSRKRREKPTPARSVCGVFSRRVAGHRWKSIAIAATPATRRARLTCFTLLCRQ